MKMQDPVLSLVAERSVALLSLLVRPSVVVVVVLLLPGLASMQAHHRS